MRSGWVLNSTDQTRVIKFAIDKHPQEREKEGDEECLSRRLPASGRMRGKKAACGSSSAATAADTKPDAAGKR